MANASDIARSISARYAPALAKVKNMYDRNSVYEIADNNSRREKELRDEAYLEAERANNQRRWEDEALERQLRIEALQDMKDQRKNAAEQAAFELSMAPYQPIRETHEDGSVKVSGQIPTSPLIKGAANAFTSTGIPLGDIIETFTPYAIRAANYQSEHPDEFPMTDGDENKDYQDYIKNSIEPYDMRYSYEYTPEDIIKQNLKHQNDLELEEQRLAKAMATQNAIYDRNVMNNQYRVLRDQQGYDFKNLYSEKEWENKKEFDDHKTKNKTDSQIAINDAKSKNNKDEYAYKTEQDINRDNNKYDRLENLENIKASNQRKNYQIRTEQEFAAYCKRKEFDWKQQQEQLDKFNSLALIKTIEQTCNQKKVPTGLRLKGTDIHRIFNHVTKEYESILEDNDLKDKPINVESQKELLKKAISNVFNKLNLIRDGIKDFNNPDLKQKSEDENIQQKTADEITKIMQNEIDNIDAANMQDGFFSVSNAMEQLDMEVNK